LGCGAENRTDGLRRDFRHGIGRSEVCLAGALQNHVGTICTRVLVERAGLLGISADRKLTSGALRSAETVALPVWKRRGISEGRKEQYMLFDLAMEISSSVEVSIYILMK